MFRKGLLVLVASLSLVATTSVTSTMKAGESKPLLAAVKEATAQKSGENQNAAILYTYRVDYLTRYGWVADGYFSSYAAATLRMEILADLGYDARVMLVTYDL